MKRGKRLLPVRHEPVEGMVPGWFACVWRSLWSGVGLPVLCAHGSGAPAASPVRGAPGTGTLWATS